MNDIRADNVPAELKALPQWVVWIWATRDGRPTKIPIDAKTRRAAAVNDAETWGNFEEAYSLATRWRTPGGIGFVFTREDPYCGVDVDKCRDVKTGEFTEGAKAVIQRLSTYTEISPSGTGAKLLMRGVIPDGRNRKDGIEFYDRGRFFTITGNHVAGTPGEIAHRLAEVAALHAEFFPPQEQSERPRPAGAPPGESCLEDEDLVRRIRRSKQGPKFDRLMAGDTTGYESASEADGALAAVLAWWTRGDRDQMLRIIRQSGLWDKKWERADYQERTLDFGIAGVLDFYDPHWRREEAETAAPTPDGDIPERQFLWMSELKIQPANEKWLWDGYLSRKGVTLLSALWKAGKTTLLAYLLKALEADGSFCGRSVKSSKVLYVTEEDQSTWAERRDELELGDHIGVACRPFLGRPNAGQWADFIGRLKSDVEDYKFDLVVFDTLAKLWPVKDENAASQVDEALIPLWAIPNAGASLLLVHHVRKGDGAEATASRGSGALTAFVETIVELRRFDATKRGDRRRVLTGHGRYRDTPEELVVELTDGGYVAHGDRDTCHQETIRDVLLDILPTAEPGLTYPEMMDKWPTDEKPRKANVLTVLKLGVESGVWMCAGKGKKGDPHRYWVNPELDREG
jgi:putative DNA primase/helicase